MQVLKWREADNEEKEALFKNHAWEITNLPVGCKWVFTIKFKVNGSIERHKARLATKGYTQTFGIDYQETFALIAKMNTVRVLLSIAAKMYWAL